MHETADVVVIGAGIHGTSLAFHLAQRGLAVAVVDREAVAAGATGVSSGWVRMHYDLLAESRLAWQSFPYFAEWADRVGGDCGFTRTGFLRIVSPERADALRSNVARQKAIGIPTEVVSAKEIRDLVPEFVCDDDEVAAYEPLSGYADPTSAAMSFMAAARALGARLATGREVSSVRVDKGRVSGVETSQGFIAAGIVVNAAGVGAAHVGALAGVDVPVAAWEEDMAFTTRPAPDGRSLPCVLDSRLGISVRPEGRELLLIGMEDASRFPADIPRDLPVVAAGFVEEVVDRVWRRLPWLENASLVRAFSGRDGVSPDQRPILGPAGPQGFYLACGFSGTGFKVAPAVGACMAELICDGQSRTADISMFSPDRFTRGELLTGEDSYGPLWRGTDT